MFPSRFGGSESESLLYYQQLQKRALALCDYLLTDDARHLLLIQAVDDWLLEQSMPEIFDDGDHRNVLTLAKQRFLRICAALASEGTQNPQDLSLVVFHARIEFLNEKYKADK